ncbi:uncharacterized protein LOC117124782 [Anneissia japonica]|uniref:uncharacterized protein LOC117124782 n=1 Tax=Anneissia japonica TaxID=1529436 RepID=UPI00142583E6|nr:uncharacterized protein LOC117124782 [Anneissia japonica]
MYWLLIFIKISLVITPSYQLCPADNHQFGCEDASKWNLTVVGIKVASIYIFTHLNYPDNYRNCVHRHWRVTPAAGFNRLKVQFEFVNMETGSDFMYIVYDTATATQTEDISDGNVQLLMTIESISFESFDIYMCTNPTIRRPGFYMSITPEFYADPYTEQICRQMESNCSRH